MTAQPEVNVNNGSECYCEVSFFDQNDNPFVPTSLSYQVDDLTNGVNIVPAGTSLTTAQSVTITITAAQNTMNAASALRERRQVLIKVGIPGGTTRNDDITYSLVRKVGTP